jgi:hypothetical protein
MAGAVRFGMHCEQLARGSCMRHCPCTGTPACPCQHACMRWGMRTMRLKAPRAAVLPPHMRMVSRSALQQQCLQVQVAGKGGPTLVTPRYCDVLERGPDLQSRCLR